MYKHQQAKQQILNVSDKEFVIVTMKLFLNSCLLLGVVTSDAFIVTPARPQLTSCKAATLVDEEVDFDGRSYVRHFFVCLSVRLLFHS